VLSRRDMPLGERAGAGHVRATLAAMTGDEALARRSSQEAVALMEESGLVLRRGLGAIDSGYGSIILGDLDGAERELRAGNEALLRAGETGTRASVAQLLADVLFRKGETDEAATFAEEARALANEVDLDAQPKWRGGLGGGGALRRGPLRGGRDMAWTGGTVAAEGPAPQ